MDEKSGTNAIYLNIAIANPANATTPLLCAMNTTYSTPILRQANQYKGSIIRMSMPLSALPYFQCPNNTFFCTLTYNGVDYKQPITLISMSSAAPTAVFYIQQFVDSLNLALAAANTLVAAANPGVGALAVPPVMTWSSVTQLFTLNVPYGTWEATAANSPKIWMSYNLSQLFANMGQVSVALNSASGKDSYFYIADRGLTSGLIPTVDETPSCIGWWTTESIVVSSGSVPSRPEARPSSISGELTTQPILTDMFISPSDRLSATNSLLYLPTSQYRYFDLMGESELRQIDLQFWACDQFGVLTAIYMPPNEGATVKFM